MSGFGKLASSGTMGLLPMAISAFSDNKPKLPTPRQRREGRNPPTQRKRQADTLLGPLGGFAAPALNKLFR